MEGYTYDTIEPLSEKAIEAYKRAIELDRNFTDAYVNLGSLYLRQKEYEKALRCFVEAAEREPLNSPACNNLGYIYEKMGRYGSAKKM